MRRLSADYLFYYSAFSLPMLMSNCLSVFVRNDGSPALSFLGMCTGAVSNIFLDWLFIFPFQMGVIGAAVASGLVQIFSLLVLLSHFIRKHGIHIVLNSIHQNFLISGNSAPFSICAISFIHPIGFALNNQNISPFSSPEHTPADYSRFSPLLSITFLYQEKESFLVRFSVPIPSSCLST